MFLAEKEVKMERKEQGGQVAALIRAVEEFQEALNNEETATTLEEELSQPYTTADGSTVPAVEHLSETMEGLALELSGFSLNLRFPSSGEEEAEIEM